MPTIQNILLSGSVKQKLQEEFGFSALRLCGSYARGLETEKSDVDLLFEEKQDNDPLLCFGAQTYLSNLFHKSVALGELGGVNALILDDVLASRIRLW